MIADDIGFGGHPAPDVVELHAGSMERVYVEIAVQAVGGRRQQVSLHTGKGIVGGGKEMVQQVATACRQLQVHVGEALTQPCLVDTVRLPLPLPFCHQAVALLYQHGVAAAGLCREVQVAGRQLQGGGIGARQQVEGDVVGAVVVGSTLQPQVTQGTMQVPGVFHIGVYVHIAAEGHDECRVGDMESLQVHLPDVARECSPELVAAWRAVERHKAIEQRTLAVELGCQATAAQGGMGCHPVKVQAVKSKLRRIGIEGERGGGCVEVGAPAADVGTCRQRCQAAGRQEALQRELMGGDMGGIGVCRQVITAVHPDTPCALRQGEVRLAGRTLDVDGSLQTGAIGDAYGATGVAIEDGCGETHVPRDAADVGMGLTAQAVGPVVGISADGEVEG